MYIDFFSSHHLKKRLDPDPELLGIGFGIIGFKMKIGQAKGVLNQLLNIKGLYIIGMAGLPGQIHHSVDGKFPDHFREHFHPARVRAHDGTGNGQVLPGKGGYRVLCFIHLEGLFIAGAVFKGHHIGPALFDNFDHFVRPQTDGHSREKNPGCFVRVRAISSQASAATAISMDREPMSMPALIIKISILL